MYLKAQVRAICTYVGCTKVTTKNQDIKPPVAVKVLLAIISGMIEHISTIKVVLCHMQVHPSRNYIPVVISSPNYTSLPSSQHIF